jgi:hypothetical protein
MEDQNDISKFGHVVIILVYAELTTGSEEVFLQGPL